MLKNLNVLDRLDYDLARSRHCIKCCVIWVEPDFNVSKTLDGMLSVLHLKRTEIMLVKVKQNPDDLKSLLYKLSIWQPKIILQLGANHKILDLPNLVHTYSPSFLVENPNYKKTAHTTLLQVRDMLNA